eukprot:Skav201031  [mRNA]  locus=scaffold3386:142589:152459:+ [translate_table: standard]
MHIYTSTSCIYIYTHVCSFKTRGQSKHLRCQDAQEFLDQATKRAYKRPVLKPKAAPDPVSQTLAALKDTGNESKWTDDAELRGVASLAIRLMDGLEGGAVDQALCRAPVHSETHQLSVPVMARGMGFLLTLVVTEASMRNDDWPKFPFYDLGTIPAYRDLGHLRGTQAAEFNKETYHEQLKDLDIAQLYESISKLMKDSKAFWPADGPQDGDVASYAGLFERLAWHCAGTLRVVNGTATGGCEGARQRHWPENEWRDNTNLDKARGLLGQVKHEFGSQISWSDLITFAGTTAIKASGGPAKKFCFGRIDDVDGKRKKSKSKMDKSGMASSKADATNLNQTISDFQPRVSKCAVQLMIDGGVLCHSWPKSRYLGGEGNTAKPTASRSEYHSDVWAFEFVVQSYVWLRACRSHLVVL